MTSSPPLGLAASLPHRVLTVCVTLVHLAFSALVVLGGLVAWWQPWVLVLHLPAVAWAVAGQVRDLPCPLTAWENAARARGGWPPLAETGYIDHYFTGVLYPASWKSRVPLIVLVILLCSWGGLLLR